MCRYKMGNPKKKSQFYYLKQLGRNQREKWHIKDLYCPICNEVVKCLEIRHCDWLEEIKDKAEKLHIEYYGKVG